MRSATVTRGGGSGAKWPGLRLRGGRNGSPRSGASPDGASRDGRRTGDVPAHPHRRVHADLPCAGRHATPRRPAAAHIPRAALAPAAALVRGREPLARQQRSPLVRLPAVSPLAPALPGSPAGACEQQPPAPRGWGSGRHAGDRLQSPPAHGRVGLLPSEDLDPAPLTGELLPDWNADDWILVERERLRQLSLHGLDAICTRLLALHRYCEAVEAGLAAVRSEPLRESAHRMLIAVHLAEGNYNEALRRSAGTSGSFTTSSALRPPPRSRRSSATCWLRCEVSERRSLGQRNGAITAR